MSNWLMEWRMTLRSLFRNPGFTLIAVITLALCVGANTAVFNIVDKTLLRDLPYPEPDNMVMLWVDASGQGFSENDFTNPADFFSWKEQLSTVDSMFAFTGWQPTLSSQGEADALPQMFPGQLVTADFTRVLGMPMHLGRGFRQEEDVPNAASVVIVSHSFWQQQLDSNQQVIGQSLMLDEQAHTIIGVLPAKLQLPAIVGGQLFRPLQAEPTQSRGGFFLRVIARLQPGVTIDVAQREFTTVQQQLALAYPETNEGLSGNVQSLHEALRGNQRPQLLALLGASLFVLLIGCVNLSNLLLVRASSRSQEFSIRAALGAARHDVTRRLLLECLALGVMGSIAGLLCALLLTDWIEPMFASASGLSGSVTAVDGIGWRLPLFVIVITLLAPMLAGLAPAMLMLRNNIQTGLRSISRGGTSGRGNVRLSHILVAGNFALALALCMAGGLLVKSFNYLQTQDLGFQSEHLLRFNINLPPDRYSDRPQIQAFQAAMQQRLQAIPGVQSLTYTSTLPFSNVFTDTSFTVEGQPLPTLNEQPNAGYSVVAPNYHQVMGIRLLRGNGFSDNLSSDGELEIIINQALAKQYFPQGDSLGKRIYFGSEESAIWARIVGEVNDIRFAGVAQPQRPSLYISQRQRAGAAVFVVINSQLSTTSLLPQLREAIRELDSSVAVANLTSMDELVRDSLAQTRYLTSLVSGFAVLALLMAAIGIYGVIAYLVNRRRRELGVRAVLGASPGKLMAQVLQTGMRLAGLGGAVGLLLALLVGRLVQQLLYQVQPFDVGIFLLAALGLFMAAVVACLVPAWRAGTVDPVVALRTE